MGLSRYRFRYCDNTEVRLLYRCRGLQMRSELTKGLIDK